MVKKTFKRTEKKYLITKEQWAKISNSIMNHTVPDPNKKARIFSLYFDTDTNTLIRRSIDKPLYKEKLRLRTYGIPSDCSQVFIEIKKKFKKTVYKRRVSMRYADAKKFLITSCIPNGYEDQHQILSEIRYFLQTYSGIKPSILISYDRAAYYGIDNPELRITIDRNIKWCSSKSCTISDEGEHLLSEGHMIMEIKTSTAMPLWLVKTLSENNIYPMSFSKVGTAYKTQLLKGVKNNG